MGFIDICLEKFENLNFRLNILKNWSNLARLFSYFHLTSHFLQTYNLLYSSGPELPFGLIFGYVTPMEG